MSTESAASVPEVDRSNGRRLVAGEAGSITRRRVEAFARVVGRGVVSRRSALASDSFVIH